MKERATHLICVALLAMLAGAQAQAFTGTNLCAVVRPDEVAALLGETPASPIATGPVADDDHAGAIATSCRFEGKSRIFALMLLDFKTASAAAAALQHDIATVKASGDARVKPVPSSGLGTDVYLASEENSATYISRSGPRLIAIGVAGETSAAPDLEGRLLKLARSAIERLPPAATKPQPSRD